MAYFGGSNIECEGCYDIFKVKSKKWDEHKVTCHDPAVKRMMQACYEAGMPSSVAKEAITMFTGEGLDRQNIRLSKIEEIKAKYHNLSLELDDYADELQAEGSTASAASVDHIRVGMMDSFDLFDAAIADMGLSSGRVMPIRRRK
jgi:hypothetical protein